MQNYEPLVGKFDITAFSSLEPIHSDFSFPVKKLFSPIGLPNFPFKLAILNRICLGDAMYLIGLEKALKGFDMAHTRETYFHFTQQALNAKKRGYIRKVLVTCSETIPFNHEGVWGRKAFKNRTLREADHFHALTNRAKQCLIKEGADAHKISVIGYGIDLKKFKPAKKQKTNQEIRLLFVGRLVKEKGIYDLLRVFVQLIKENHKISLTIIGNGQKKESILNLANQDLLKKVINFKKVPYEMMPSVYQQADIFALPSKRTKHWEEYYGMALIEAMASGLAIVTTDCGAIPEVSGKKALISPQDDELELYNNLKSLIINKALRKKYQREALRWARSHFDAEKQAEKIGRLYKRI